MLEFYVDSLITIHFFNYHGGVIISELMINGQIRDKEVRLIANDGEQLGIMSEDFCWCIDAGLYNQGGTTDHE